MKMDQGGCIGGVAGINFIRHDGYGQADVAAFKGAVADAVVAFAEPYAARTNELLAAPDHLATLMRDGAQRARDVAVELLQRVYERIGFVSAT